jgi:hypothetical protein
MNERARHRASFFAALKSLTRKGVDMPDILSADFKPLTVKAAPKDPNQQRKQSIPAGATVAQKAALLKYSAGQAAPAPTPIIDPVAEQAARDEATFLGGTGTPLPPHRLQALATHGQTPAARIGAMMTLGKF